MTPERRREHAREIAQRLYRLGPWRLFNDGDRALGHECVTDVAIIVCMEDLDAIGVCGFFYRIDGDQMVIDYRMRSCGAVNVARIARANGGSGHGLSAEFSVPAGRFALDPVSIFERCMELP